MKLRFAPHLIAACTAMACAGASLTAHAETGKLLLTGGVSSIDGAAGGGLTPWAVIGSNATEGEIGGSAFFSTAGTKDYGLNIVGAAIGIHDRYEISVARQDFNTRATGTALGLPGLHLKQSIVGFKARVAGDAILDSDSLMPQVAVGVEFKNLGSTGLDGTLRALGAKREGVDLYVSATKLFLGQSLLVNGTLRATKANQNGLLGFGATGHTSYKLQPEVSVAYLLSKRIAIGAEYRAKPDNLRDNTALGAGALDEDDWSDVFIAWAPSKHLSLTAAYVDLGKIVPGVVNRRQKGGYISAQIAF
jgi:hypothetical protein